MSYKRLVVSDEDNHSDGFTTTREQVTEKTPLLSNGNSSRAVNA